MNQIDQEELIREWWVECSRRGISPISDTGAELFSILVEWHLLEGQGLEDLKVRNPKTDRDIKVSTALTYDKTHPAYIAASKLLKSKEGSIDKETPSKNKHVNNPISDQAKQAIHNKLQMFREAIRKEPDDVVKQRGNSIIKTVDKFITAETVEEQVEVLSYLLSNDLIKFGRDSKMLHKMYVDSTATGLPRKIFGDGNKVVEYMYQLAKKNHLPIVMADEVNSSLLSDTKGKYNEAGISVLLDPSKENTALYDRLTEKMNDISPDETKYYHSLNVKAAEKTKQFIQKLYPESKIISAKAIGTEMASQKQISKSDPTDILVRVQDKDGDIKEINFSQKIYSNPTSIKLKNAGIKTFGTHYLQDSEFDNKMIDIREKFKYNDIKNSDKRERYREKLRIKMTKEIFKKVKDISKTEDGQKVLGNLWNDVHGLNAKNPVYTQIINSTTGEVHIKTPEDLKFKGKFKISSSATMLSVIMKDESGHQTKLQIRPEADSNGAVTIVFNTISSK